LFHAFLSAKHNFGDLTRFVSIGDQYHRYYLTNRSISKQLIQYSSSKSSQLVILNMILECFQSKANVRFAPQAAETERLKIAQKQPLVMFEIRQHSPKQEL